MSLVLPSVQAQEGNRVAWQTQWWSSYVFAHKPRCDVTVSPSLRQASTHASTHRSYTHTRTHARTRTSTCTQHTRARCSLLLSPRNTQRLHDMTASTLLWLLKPRLLALCEHLGGIMQISPHRDVDMWGRVWMSRFRGAWQNLNFDKEYLFGFETLVFATSGILSMHNQLVTLQRERKTWNRNIWPL